MTDRHAWDGYLNDPSYGACSRRRQDGCAGAGLGPWYPFYQSHVCTLCLHGDQDDLEAGRWPFKGKEGESAHR